MDGHPGIEQVNLQPKGMHGLNIPDCPNRELGWWGRDQGGGGGLLDWRKRDDFLLGRKVFW